jgi:hypothetical protein
VLPTHLSVKSETKALGSTTLASQLPDPLRNSTR